MRSRTHFLLLYMILQWQLTKLMLSSIRWTSVSALLSDSSLRELLIQRLTEGGHVARQSMPLNQNDGVRPEEISLSVEFGPHSPFVPFLTRKSPHTPPITGNSQLSHDSAFGSDQPGFSRRRARKKTIIWMKMKNLLLMMMLGRPVMQSTLLLRRTSTNHNKRQDHERLS